MLKLMEDKYGGTKWNVEMRWFWGRLQGRVRELGGGEVRKALMEDMETEKRVNAEVRRRVELELERERAEGVVSYEKWLDEQKKPDWMLEARWAREKAQRRIEYQERMRASGMGGKGGAWQRGQMRTA